MYNFIDKNVVNSRKHLSKHFSHPKTCIDRFFLLTMTFAHNSVKLLNNSIIIIFSFLLNPHPHPAALLFFKPVGLVG